MSAVPQHMAALGKANENRLGRSYLRKEVLALGSVDGRVRLAELIETPPQCIETMMVGDILCWLHRVREVQARRILTGVRVATVPPVVIREARAVKDLSPRERSALVRYLAGERATESRWAA